MSVSITRSIVFAQNLSHFFALLNVTYMQFDVFRYMSLFLSPSLSHTYICIQCFQLLLLLLFILQRYKFRTKLISKRKLKYCEKIKIIQSNTRYRYPWKRVINRQSVFSSSSFTFTLDSKIVLQH